MKEPHAKNPEVARKIDTPRLWTSIEELANDPNFEDWLKAEFPSIANIVTSARRREFLKLMGASFLMAAMAGCQQDTSGTAVPYVRQPEGAHPDKPQHFATAIPFSGYGQPVLATVYDGRPTKLDGNPDHPLTRGASDPFMQAAVLGLYDPERSQTPLYNGDISTWSEFSTTLTRWRHDWAANKGEGVRLLIGQTTSPTLIRQAKEFLEAFPAAKIHVFEPIEDDSAWTTEVFGRRLDVHFEIEKCDAIVSFGHDLLGPGVRQVAYSRAWSERRGDAKKRIRLHVAEPSPTITGSIAASRFIASGTRTGTLVQALAASFGLAKLPDNLSPEEKSWITPVADELRSAKGRSFVAAGPSQPSWVHALTAKINDALSNTGKTVWYSEPVTSSDARFSDLRSLVKDAHDGKVQSLFCLDTNPIYTAEGELDFASAMQKISHRVHVGLYRDETTRASLWHLPLCHPLESWNDYRATDGSRLIAQPLIRPLHDTRTLPQFFAMLLGSTIDDSVEPIKATWQIEFSQDFDTRWKKALRDGFIETPALVPVNAKPNDVLIPTEIRDSTAIEVVFKPDPTIWDGRYANNGWLQELPKPLLTTTWDNVLAISPALAKELSLKNGDNLEVTIEKRKVTGPAWILPGQAPRTITAYFGYGRSSAGSLGSGRGYNAYSIRSSSSRWLAIATLNKAPGETALAVTQMHHRLEGFDFVREVTDDAPTLKPAKPQESLYPRYGRAEHAWAMAIDTDLCTGCNACVAACTAENNVPVVGHEEVARGREMHWIRIARYYSGEPEQPRSFFQPVPCMHCEEAPCEMGCPVHATVHSPEGLNQMVYNRCIGTRTCSSYCPYKVRRFNYFDYRAPENSLLHAAHNPDVTVRSRGVMEKCTYCTQRIENAKAQANIEDRKLRRDEVVTACQAACPTQAITFGDLNDPDSTVSARRKSGRHYALLEELGTKPRTTYLARWKDTFPAPEEKS